MKKIGILLMCMFLIPTVLAVYKPQPLTIMPLTIEPVAPGTGDTGECVPWEIKNEVCVGNVRHWQMCQKTVSGGVWQEHSEICTDYGANTKCINGECVKAEDLTKAIFYGLGIILIIILIIYYGIKIRREK